MRRTALLTVLFVSVDSLFRRMSFAQEKPENNRIRIGYAAQAAPHSIPFLAKEAGFFKDEGLQVEVVRTAGAVAPMALLSGDVDLSISFCFGFRFSDFKF